MMLDKVIIHGSNKFQTYWSIIFLVLEVEKYLWVLLWSHIPSYGFATFFLSWFKWFLRFVAADGCCFLYFRLISKSTTSFGGPRLLRLLLPLQLLHEPRHESPRAA